MTKSDIVKWHITQVATGYTSDPTFVLFPLCCVSSFMLIVSSQLLLIGPLYTAYAVAIVCQAIGRLLYGFSASREVKVDSVLSTSQITHEFTSLSLYP